MARVTKIVVPVIGWFRLLRMELMELYLSRNQEMQKAILTLYHLALVDVEGMLNIASTWKK